MILTQLAIFLAILIKLVNRRRKFNHINDWITRPLMERYKATLDAHIYEVSLGTFLLY